jgi:hypothetical protein
MKTVLFIISVVSAFLLAQNKKMMEQKQVVKVTVAYTDSVHEAGRIEMMKNKMR